MNRLDFALRTVRYVLDACNESRTVPEDALVFASKVLVTLLPLLDPDRQRELTPAIVQIIHRIPPAHRPVDLARSTDQRGSTGPREHDSDAPVPRDATNQDRRSSKSRAVM